jgi:ParB family chromosome partitioning protein
MPKRGGLGKRGLDLLISASGGKGNTDPDTGNPDHSDSLKRNEKSIGSQTDASEHGNETGDYSAGSDSDELQGQKSKTMNTEASETEEMHSGPVMVPLSSVEPNRSQPRKNFDEDALQELADSVKQFGIIQPLIVQKKDGYYEIIAGERRWRAARIAALKEVPVIIRDYTPKEVMEISLIENIQREDLNPIEEAGAYKRLMEEYDLKQDEVAQRVSKSRAAIANAVRLLNLDERVQNMVIAEMLSTGHARALLAISEPDLQFQIAQRVFDEKLTVRDVEKLVRKMNAPTTGQPVKKQISDALAAVYADLSEQMKTSLGTKVSISPKSAQKGRIEIEYYSSDELDRLCTLLNSFSQGEGV